MVKREPNASMESSDNRMVLPSADAIVASIDATRSTTADVEVAANYTYFHLVPCLSVGSTRDRFYSDVLVNK
jgi:hypothetical protein